MAERPRTPTFVPATAYDDKFRFTQAGNYDPEAAKEIEAIHVVVSDTGDSAAYVPAGGSMIRIGPTPGHGRLHEPN